MEVATSRPRLEDVPAAVIATDLDGVVTSWNASAEALYGWTADEALGRPIHELTVPPDARDEATDILTEVAGGDVWRGTFTALRKDGTTIEAEVLDAALRDEAGRVVGFVGVSIPLEPGPWRPLVEYALDALSLHDTNGRYRYVSPRFESLLGFDAADLVGRDPYELFHPEDLDDIRAAHDSLTGPSRSSTVQYRIQRADHTYLWVETASQLTADGTAIVAATRPVGVRRSLLHALEFERSTAGSLRAFEAERTAFLTTIAHRARHPITAVMGMAEVLERTASAQLDDASRHLLARLRVRAVELKELIESVTTAHELAARTASIDRSPVDLADLVQLVLTDFAEPEAPIHVDIPPGVFGFVDREKLELALRALLQNAVRHTPIGTSVWIGTAPHADGLILYVEDDGPGVPEHARSEAFQAFRHAAGDQHDPSMGLGLYVVAEVASAHGGHAWIEDRPGGGASIRMLIRQRRTSRPAVGLERAED